MKKITKSLLCLMLAFVLCAAVPNEVQAAGGYITTNCVNLRTSTRTDVEWNILGQVNRGDGFYVIDSRGGASWYHVHMTSGRNKGKEGYVSAGYCQVYR